MPSTQTHTWGPAEVDADVIAAFARGINHTGTGAHPLFIARGLIPGSAKVLMQPDLSIDIQRIVHAGLELTFHSRAREGDPLYCASHLESLEDKETGTLIAIHISVNAGDRLLADGITRYFIRGATRAAKREPPPPLDGPDLVQVEVSTRPDQSQLYAVGSGDRFPIHTDEAFARAVGLPGVIMHGMCTLALCVDAMVEAAPHGDLARLGGLSCRFAAMLQPGQAIHVVGLADADGMRFEARRPDGRLVISDARLEFRAEMT